MNLSDSWGTLVRIAGPLTIQLETSCTMVVRWLCMTAVREIYLQHFWAIFDGLHTCLCLAIALGEVWAAGNVQKPYSFANCWNFADEYWGPLSLTIVSGMPCVANMLFRARMMFLEMVDDRVTTSAVYIITVGHRPFTIRNAAMAAHFSLVSDKMVGQLWIVSTNSHLYYSYISARSIVNIITATQTIVYM